MFRSLQGECRQQTDLLPGPGDAGAPSGWTLEALSCCPAPHCQRKKRRVGPPDSMGQSSQSEQRLLRRTRRWTFPSARPLGCLFAQSSSGETIMQIRGKPAASSVLHPLSPHRMSTPRSSLMMKTMLMGTSKREGMPLLSAA